MEEEFSGLGSTFYVGLPGQSIGEMQEVKQYDALQYFKMEDIEQTDKPETKRSYPLTFEIVDDHSFERTKLYHFMQQQQLVYREYMEILKETELLMASWLKRRRSVSRFIRLRRHYNRWRRCYATRKTFYTVPFHKFIHAFMVEYVAMRTYHSKKNGEVEVTEIS